MKAKIKAFILKNSGFKKMSVTGYTEGATVLKGDYALSRLRAKKVAGFISAITGSELKLTSLFSKQEKIKSPALRRVVIYLSN
jgi:hypothetical protein